MSKRNGNGKPGKSAAAAKADQKQRGQRRSRARARGVAGLDIKSLNPLSVSAPVAVSKIQRMSKPKMVTRPNGDCRITHREYVADISAGANSPSDFTVQQFSINPGQVNLFQWLSKVAANYESYVFNQLRFDYATEAPSSLGGTLVLAVDYDASDPAPTSKQQAMAYRSSVRSAPWAPCQHISSGEDLKKAKTSYVRNGAQPPNTDIKTYDIGNLFVISQGVTTANAVLGELWVEYDILLMTPVFENGGGLAPVGGSFAGAVNLTAANPFGDLPMSDPSNYGIAIDNTSTLELKFPGQYIVEIYYSGTVITASAGVPTMGITVTPYNALPLASGAEGVFSFLILANNPGFVTFAATATTITGSNMTVSAAPRNSLDT